VILIYFSICNQRKKGNDQIDCDEEQVRIEMINKGNAKNLIEIIDKPFHFYETCFIQNE